MNFVRDLDFDDIIIVKEVCETYQKFVDWNKGYFDYEIFETKIPLDYIYIAHNLWDKGELSSAEQFFEDLDEVLNEYIQIYPDNREEMINDVMRFFIKFR